MIPAGVYAASDGEFEDVGKYSKLWSSSEIDSVEAWGLRMDNSSGFVDFGKYTGRFSKADGLSIRCVKD